MNAQLIVSILSLVVSCVALTLPVKEWIRYLAPHLWPPTERPEPTPDPEQDKAESNTDSNQVDVTVQLTGPAPGPAKCSTPREMHGRYHFRSLQKA